MRTYVATAALLVSVSLPAYCQPAVKAAQQATPPSTAQLAITEGEAQKKAAAWVATLQLPKASQQAAVQQVIVTHLLAIHAYEQAHPYTETPAGLNPTTGKPLSSLERQLIAASARPAAIHEQLMSGLQQHLSPAQVEAVLDQYTIGKVAFTLRGYHAIIPDLTATEEEVLLANLKRAREQAVDFTTMKQISAIFEIYKTQNELYLNTHGRNWRDVFSAYVKAANAQKAANKATNGKMTAP
jgi:hypothetical protein